MRILITGATGLIGREIGKTLAERGHEIIVVSRSLAKAREVLPFPCEVVVGDFNQGPLEDDKLKDVQAVFNLMGEPVVEGRWTPEKKARIYNSRVVGTQNLVKSLSESVQVFVSGSAMGFYGDSKDEILYEDHTPGKDFLAKVCVDWEVAAAKAPGRKVFIRTGLVLSRDGGVLDEMLFPFRAGVGGPLGSGRQWMSWIHLKDIVGLFLFALDNPKVQGPLNGVAPEPETNQDFSRLFAEALHKHLGPAMPLLVLKMIFGEVGDVMISSARGSAEKSMALGYKFHYEKLDRAFADLCSPYEDGEDVFYAEQFLTDPPEKVFPFFQEANNLEKITPPTLQFHIEKVSATHISQGTHIDYRLKIHGVPTKWKTEIDEWQPPYKFVDRQMRGPYRLWHHTHEFRPFCGGTLLVDKVRYRLPLGYLGWILGAKFIRKDIEDIFSFRRKYIATNLGANRRQG